MIEDTQARPVTHFTRRAFCVWSSDASFYASLPDSTAAGFTHPNAQLAASFIPHPGAPLDDARHTLQCQRHVRIGQAVLAGRLGLFGGNPVIRIMIWLYRAEVYGRSLLASVLGKAA